MSTAIGAAGSSGSLATRCYPALHDHLGPVEENALIQAAQAGDPAAFDRLVAEYQDYLYRLMVRACHHPDDAEEVASEAFVRAYERLCQFEGSSSFVTWLGRIATNLCFRRREKAELPSVSLEERSREEEGHPDRTPPSPGLRHGRPVDCVPDVHQHGPPGSCLPFFPDGGG